jgi:hypothetical protein
VLPAVNPASDGSFSFTDTPAAGGLHMYWIVWAGDHLFFSAQAAHDVEVRGGFG